VKPVLTATEAKRVDQSYADLSTAMERAGHAVALAAARHGAGYGKRVVILAGPGNNGGDGYVAARHLKRRGVWVRIQALGGPNTPEAARAANQARAEGISMAEMGAPVDCDLVLDAIYGGGAHRGLPDQVVAWMATDAPVIAVDFPTGLDPDTGEVEDQAFRAVETVTFSTHKTGHLSGVGPDLCGVVTVADVGIHGGRPSMYLAEEGDALRPVRSRTDHKWSVGSVLVVGGSQGMVGAAVLAARAALNFGAGSVYLSSSHAEQAHQIAPEIPSLLLDEAEGRLDKFDVVIAGPGLGASEVEAALPLVRKARRVVLDAGGLVKEMVEAATDGGSEVIVTPHAAEFKRIAEVGGGKFSTRSYATRRGLTILYKGNPTVVTDGGPPILVTSGGPELATIGTGDVLAGMVGALWARGLDSMTAAVSAAYWHGVAGAELARRRMVTAGALVDLIGSYAR
jgi:NAD(P)H-hydrate epimerase